MKNKKLENNFVALINLVKSFEAKKGRVLKNKATNNLDLVNKNLLTDNLFDLIELVDCLSQIANHKTVKKILKDYKNQKTNNQSIDILKTKSSELPELVQIEKLLKKDSNDNEV